MKFEDFAIGDWLTTNKKPNKIYVKTGLNRCVLIYTTEDLDRIGHSFIPSSNHECNFVSHFEVEPEMAKYYYTSGLSYFVYDKILQQYVCFYSRIKSKLGQIAKSFDISVAECEKLWHGETAFFEIDEIEQIALK